MYPSIVPQLSSHCILYSSHLPTVEATVEAFAAPYPRIGFAAGQAICLRNRHDIGIKTFEFALFRSRSGEMLGIQPYGVLRVADLLQSVSSHTQILPITDRSSLHPPIRLEPDSKQTHDPHWQDKLWSACGKGEQDTGGKLSGWRPGRKCGKLICMSHNALHNFEFSPPFMCEQGEMWVGKRSE
ncbi:hypothetical protein SUNI508_04036 [Seiridium unicorne]|uniref:Uncharacterized protein n=1 Tax=Seiridium unicorne TaxID=138068 RepID=A0ABR2VAR5_9PEZI